MGPQGSLAGSFVFSASTEISDRMWEKHKGIIIIGGFLFIGIIGGIVQENMTAPSNIGNDFPVPSTASSQTQASSGAASSQQIKQLQNEIDQLKRQQTQGATPQSGGDASQITTADLAPYMTGIGNVVCYDAPPTYGTLSNWHDSGSGSLWKIGGKEYALTNQHVIQTSYCTISIDAPPTDPSYKGIYGLDVEHSTRWNSITDVAVVPLLDTPAALLDSAVPFVPKDQLNYKISTLRYCPSTITEGSPVALIGYPAYSFDESVGVGLRTESDGIIAGSASFSTPVSLLYDNFFVSAKMDEGNSGGIAFAKDQNGLCLLGIPTWVQSGQLQNEGVVQNIQNVTWVKN